MTHEWGDESRHRRPRGDAESSMNPSVGVRGVESLT